MSVRIDVIAANIKPLGNWSYGNQYSCEYSVMSIVSMIQRALADSAEGLLYFLCEEDSQPPLPSSFQENADLWYNVVSSGQSLPLPISLIVPGNYFNLSLPGNYSLWDIRLHGLVIRKSVIQSIGFLDPRFETVEMALVEWLYRALFKGVLFRPAEQVNVRPSSIKYPTTDQLLFIRLRWNKAWFVYVLIRYLLMGRVDNTCTVTNLRSLWKLRSAIQSKPIRHEGWKDHDLMQSAYPVSVIIPTVERYSYLFTVLKHLQKQTIKPREVIVIDQTPVKLRQEQFVQDFGDIGLIYLTLETLGQCTSRNMGLLKSTGDYILFIDDDVELKPDVIEKHLKCLEYFDADVSCGVCDEVGAGPVSPDFNLIRNSDVLPTNNGMVRRSALMKSGLFDRAFNQGQRADGELGARLYKSGARLILNPEIRVLHHRAPRGGLRKHQVRKVTYATSRKYITHFRLPHATEIYLNRLHFSKAEQQEAIVLSLLGCFSIRGGFIKRVVKVLFATFIFPVLLIRIYNRSKVAGNLLKQYPQVDFLLPDQ